MELSREIYSLFNSTDVRSVIHLGVSSKQADILSDFVRTTIRDKNLSYRAVANASGGLINHTTVGDFINKNNSKYTIQALQGLAKGLGVSEDLIFDLARGKSPDTKTIMHNRFAAIAESFVELPEQMQKNLEPLVEALELTIKAQPKEIGEKRVVPPRVKRVPKTKEAQVLDETVYEEKK